MWSLKRVKSLGRYSLLAAMAVGVAGCAQTASLEVWRPAQIDLPGIERIAVLDFQGLENTGQIARSAVSAEMFDNGFYQMVDPAELTGYVARASATDPPTEATIQAAVEAARTMGVDALLVGDVLKYQVVDDERNHSHVHFINGGGGDFDHGMTDSFVGVGFENRYVETREATVAMGFRLIDTRSQDVIATRQVSFTQVGQRVNGQGYIPARETALAAATARCADEIVATLAPHRRPISVTLVGGGLGKAGSEIRRGNKLAVAGDWHAAAGHWEAALESDPACHAAMHNLALAREAAGDYASARELLGRAIEIKPKRQYLEIKRDIDDRERQYRRAMAQHERRSKPASAAKLEPMSGVALLPDGPGEFRR